MRPASRPSPRATRYWRSLPAVLARDHGALAIGTGLAQRCGHACSAARKIADPNAVIPRPSEVFFCTYPVLYVPFADILAEILSRLPVSWRHKMSISDTALMVIDVQESFRQRPFWSDADVPVFMERLQRLVDGAKAQNIPVVQIFHVADSGPFSVDSGFVQSLSPLSIASDAVFHKRKHSALVGTGLDVWLFQNGIRRVIISGIRTEQCCETTTRHASDIGYSVDFVSEATLTFAMTDARERTWSADEIKSRSELVLHQRFARIATIEQALAGPASKLAA